MWVAADNARILADASPDAPVVASPAMGAPLAVLSSADGWLKVRTESGETGWIYEGRVSTAPPAAPGADLDDLLADMGDSAILLAAADTSRSIRGRKDEAAGDGSAAPDPLPPHLRRALDRALSVYVDPEELEAFLREGGIGAYAAIDGKGGH